VFVGAIVALGAGVFVIVIFGTIKEELVEVEISMGVLKNVEASVDVIDGKFTFDRKGKLV